MTRFMFSLLLLLFTTSQAVKAQSKIVPVQYSYPSIGGGTPWLSSVGATNQPPLGMPIHPATLLAPQPEKPKAEDRLADKGVFALTPGDLNGPLPIAQASAMMSNSLPMALSSDGNVFPENMRHSEAYKA